MDADKKRGFYDMSFAEREAHNKEFGKRLRERMENRKFLRRYRGRQVPQRNPQGLNKPMNERG